MIETKIRLLFQWHLKCDTMRLLLFSIFFVLVNGLKNFDPNLLVNTTDSDAAWISVPGKFFVRLIIYC